MTKEENTYIVPLTKDMKKNINITISEKLDELDRCDATPYVNLYKAVYGVTKNIVNALQMAIQFQ